METEIRIMPDGTIVTMHSDDVMLLMTIVGRVTISRASHVEPVGTDWGVWTAAGQDTGGRFTTRAAALEWERANFWNLIGKEAE